MNKRQKTLSSNPISFKATNTYFKSLDETKTCPDMETGNGANTFSTSGSKVVDLFFQLARGCPESTISKLMSESWNESPLETCLVLLQGRDCRDGKGERLVTYHALIWIRQNYPEVYQQLLPSIVQVGSFADLKKLAGMACEAHKKLKKSAEESKATMLMTDVETVNLVELELFAAVLKQDQHLLRLSKPSESISLAAKWAPSENKKFDRRYDLAKKLAHLWLKPTPDDLHSGVMHRYRNLLKDLRRMIAPVEILLASKRFSEVNYNKQTSRGHHVYKKAFFRNDPERYKEYLATLKKQQEENKNKPEAEQKKEVKINISTLFPHEIVHKYVHQDAHTEEENDLRQTQWNATIEKYKKFKNILSNSVAIVDVSGSMMSGYSGTSVCPMDVSVALGLLIANVCNKEKFKNQIITFHDTPSWCEIDTSNHISEQVQQILRCPWGGSTNFEAAMKLILEKAQTQEDLPEMCICISDMCFDAASSSRSGFYSSVKKSLFQDIRKQYELKELKMPKMVFWNVNSAICDNSPVTQHESGTALISGFSPAIMKAFLEENGLDDLTPKKLLMNSIKPYENLISSEFKQLLSSFSSS